MRRSSSHKTKVIFLFRKPGDLRYVPREYRFEGRALFDLPSIKQSYLSFAYDGIRDELHCIGVSSLTISQLCDEFDLWIAQVGIDGHQDPAGAVA